METNKLHSRLADDDDRKKIWLDLPYNSNLGKLDFGGRGGGGGEKLEKILIKKIKRYFKEKVNIVVKYRTNNYLYFVQRKME